MPTAVQVHNVLGFLLIANAFLGLFYYVTTGTIRQYLPEPHDFVSLSVRQAWFYLRGMFRGEPHPLEKIARAAAQSAAAGDVPGHSERAAASANGDRAC